MNPLSPFSRINRTDDSSAPNNCPFLYSKIGRTHLVSWPHGKGGSSLGARVEIPSSKMRGLGEAVQTSSTFRDRTDEVTAVTKIHSWAFLTPASVDLDRAGLEGVQGDHVGEAGNQGGGGNFKV